MIIHHKFPILYTTCKIVALPQLVSFIYTNNILFIL